MKRYRVRANGNGEYRIERKMLLFWRGLDKHGKPVDTGHDFYTATYTEAVDALKKLEEIRSRDARDARSRQWFTVAEE